MFVTWQTSQSREQQKMRVKRFQFWSSSSFLSPQLSSSLLLFAIFPSFSLPLGTRCHLFLLFLSIKLINNRPWIVTFRSKLRGENLRQNCRKGGKRTNGRIKERERIFLFVLTSVIRWNDPFDVFSLILSYKTNFLLVSTTLFHQLFLFPLK